LTAWKGDAIINVANNDLILGGGDDRFENLKKGQNLKNSIGPLEIMLLVCYDYYDIPKG
jgi:hypothetical protein